MFDLSTMGWWDEIDERQYIYTADFGLPMASVHDDSESDGLMRDWLRGELQLNPLEDVPLSSIDASVQGVVRRDVLEFYLAGSGETFDGPPSSWGADGPLAVRLGDGRTVLIDGTHRWTTALIRGKETFTAQVLRR